MSGGLDQGHVDRGGFRLSVAVSGRREGAPALLVSNSLGASMRMWAPQLALLESRYRVIRYDTRGHGGSDSPPGPYSFDDLVGDMLAVLDHAGAGRADVLGLSLGGMTALGLGLAAPGRVGRMVVVAARADNPPPFVKSWDDRIAAIHAGGGVGAIWPGTLERWLTPEFQAANPTAVEDLRREFLRTTVAGYEGCARALQGLNYLGRLGELDHEVTYVAGAQDMGAPADAMRAMAAATPRASFHAIAEAAHIVNVNVTEAFNAIIGEVLTGAGQ